MSRTEPAVARGRALAPWLVVWLMFLPLALMRAGTLAEADTFWQIRTGLLTLSEGAIPRTDSFSWTAFGEPWTLNSWAFNVLLAGAYRLGGLAGVALSGAALVMILIALILLAAWRLAAAPQVTGIVIFLGSLPLVAWLSVRPQLADYIAVLALTIILSSLAEGPRPGVSVLAVGILCALWVNLHAAALLAIAITGTCAALLLARRGTRQRGYWGVAATGAAIGGTLANPYGATLLSQAADVQSVSSGSIIEWQAPGLGTLGELVMLAVGVVALVIAVRMRNSAYSAALGVCLAGSVSALRFAPIVLVVAIPVLAAAASRPAFLEYLRSRRVVLIPGAALLALTVVIASLPALRHLGQPVPSVFPANVVSQIPPGCRVFTSYLLGGFVELQRPDVTVNVDSRNDLFGEARVLAADDVLAARGDVEGALAGAGCALVPPTSALAGLLGDSPEWSLVGREDVTVLYVRVRG